MKKHEKNLYKAHCVPAALLFSFDDLSISGDYDTGLNENKTVCEQPKRKIPAGTGENRHFSGNEWRIVRKIQKICKV